MPQDLPDNFDQSAVDTRLQAIQQRAERAPQDASANPAYTKPIQLLSWTSESRLYDPKSPQWYLGLFAMGLVGVIVFAIFQEVLLILLVAAAIFVFYAMARVQPPIVEHGIYNTGVRSAGRMYTWKELRSFWISDVRGVTVLRLDTTLHFVHTVEILLNDVDADHVRDELQKHIPMLEKAAPEAGAMADHALVSVANKIPFRNKLLDWVESSTGYAGNDQQSNSKN